MSVAAPTRNASFARRRDDRVVAGVAGGFAAGNGVDPFLLRAALVVLSLAGGVGGVLYAVGLVLSGPPLEIEAPARSRPDRNAAVALVSVGLLFGCRGLGLWPGDAVMIPVLAVAAALVIVAVVSGDAPVATKGPLPLGRLAVALSGRFAPLRLLIGAALVTMAVLGVGRAQGLVGWVQTGVLGAVLAIVGLALVLGPWLTQLIQQLGDERRERIRSEERAAMAAHLHDSVLQTLALIQRGADDPRRTVTLARRQERELRAWLYGGLQPRSGDPARSVSEGVADLVAEIEELHRVRVDAVVVGDGPADRAVAALFAAAREAMVNAAKHAAVDEVSLYVEVAPGSVSAYVRDRGAGFDPDAVAEDRRGLRSSVRDRIGAVGGTVEIDSSPGAGTEVRLVVPLRTEEEAAR
ncbi:MAG: PspC domain-containing protein [Acidimicrobiia bacterium]|nr:PspC domain-containing protein [Acidimicrobiia bacterium]